MKKLITAAIVASRQASLPLPDKVQHWPASS
jgi:hypothetical protein